MEGYLDELEAEITLRGLSNSTMKAYMKYNGLLLSKTKKAPEDITKREIKSFLASMVRDGVASRTINLARSALLFFYNEVLEKGFVGIKIPKIKKSLPIFLTKKEISMLINASGSNKSRLMIQFLYSSGLRVSEICTARVEEIDFSRGRGYVRDGKGGKDRLFFLGKDLSLSLKEFVGQRQTGFVFENKNGHRLSERNIQKIISTTARRAGIMKHVTPHKLRHSFATHLHDSGVSIRTIQELLGHSNLQTTEIYTHVSAKKLEEVQNPLDDMQETIN